MRDMKAEKRRAKKDTKRAQHEKDNEEYERLLREEECKAAEECRAIAMLAFEHGSKFGEPHTSL